MADGFDVGLGPSFPKLPAPDSEDTYSQTEIQSARKGVKIGKLTAGQTVTLPTKNLQFENMEGEKTIATAKLAPFAKWFSLTDAEVKDGKVLYTLTVLPGKTTKAGRVVRASIATRVEIPGAPQSTEWYFTVA